MQTHAHKHMVKTKKQSTHTQHEITILFSTASAEGKKDRTMNVRQQTHTERLVLQEILLQKPD